MGKKLRLAVLFGGRSGEHEVSLDSADSVIKALNKNKYDIIPVGISKKGEWFTKAFDEKSFSCSTFFSSDNIRKVFFGDPSLKGMLVLDGNKFQKIRIDVVFPVLHGTYGEDGAVQGLLEVSELPYAGCGILGSSAGMDKEYMKKLFKFHKLPSPAYHIVYNNDDDTLKKAESKASSLGYPVYIKPANGGSSVGISKVDKAEDIEKALTFAFKYDSKILIEKGIDAREIECSVIGSYEPITSCLGEIVPASDFYDYKAKYKSNSSKLELPAKVDKKTEQQIRAMAARAFRAIDGYGFSRVDFLLDKKTGKIYVNEVNTIPGFTKISMFPKLWAQSGIPYGELLDIIINMAIDRDEVKKNLSRNFQV